MAKKYLIAILIVVLIVAVIYAVSNRTTKPTKSPYIIGAVFDVTGSSSPLGTPERDTVNMIAASINEKGGINGHEVKFVVYDNGSEETKCVLAVKKLIEADNVKAIIGPSATGTTLAVANICEKAGIPIISCAAGNKITDPVKPHVFKTAQSDRDAVAKVVDYLKANNMEKIAFIYDSNAFGVSGREQIQDQAPKAGIDVISYESFGSQDTDMTSQLTRIRAKNPQAIVCWGTNPGPAMVAKNAVQLGIKTPLVMSHGISNKKFIELAGKAAEGVIFPSGKIIVADSIPSTDPQKKVLLEYAEEFESMFKREADHFGGHAWDGAHLIINAMSKVGDDPAKIRDEIERTKDFVGIGGVFSFSESDHNGLDKNAFVMVQIKNGEWVLME